MTDNNQVATKRELQVARLRERYPDKKFEDDEEIFGQIGDDYDRYERENGEYKSMTESIKEMFGKDPRSTQFLADMYNGKDPVVGMIETYGPEIRDVLDNPEMADKLAEANKAYVERVAKERNLEDQYSKNLEGSIETLRQFQEQKGLSDDEVDEVLGKVLQIVQDGVLGKFTPETLEMVSKAVSYDSDMANAAEEGRIAGRNDKIEEKLRKREMGDGTNPLSGKNGMASAGRGKNVFDLANEAMS